MELKSKNSFSIKNFGPVAFMGDSIAEGFGVLPPDSCWHVFSQITGMDVIRSEDINPVAYAGIGVKEFAGRIDNLMEKWKPKTVFLSIGANNFDDSCTASYPFGITTDEIAFFIKSIIYCIRGYGAIPFWIGLPPFEDCGTSQEKPRRFNSMISQWLESENLPSFFYLDRLIKEDSWDAMGGQFFNNLAVDKHPNESGQRLIAEVCTEAMATFHKITL